jgi:DNA-binding beta-propeller fold protein YncE
MQKHAMLRLTLLALIASASLTAVHADELQYPLSVAAGKDGVIYVADKDMHGIWKIYAGKLEPLFRGSNKFRTPLNAVWCVGVDPKGRVVAGDSATREVYRFNDKNEPEPLTKGGVGIPWALAFDSKGDILVCDLEIHQVVKVPGEGGEPVKVAQVAGPRGIAIDAADRAWVVSGGGKNQVLRVDPQGNVETVVEGRPFQFPLNITLDKEQNAYLCDNYSHAIWKIPKDGKPEKFLADKPLDMPVGITFTGDGLLIADPHAKMVFEATLDGKISPLKFAAPAK